ncbi:MAG: hypothetical protein PVJ27_03985 [Candidatus Brocadiaceae bacterium]|jgi:hypothetical protein
MVWKRARELSGRERFRVGLLAALVGGIALGYVLRPPSTEELVGAAEAEEARLRRRVEQMEKELRTVRAQLRHLGS